jgi:hypothetical protein
MQVFNGCTDRKGDTMRSPNQSATPNNNADMGFSERESEEGPEHEYWHHLDEIQRRACRIHRRHGAIYGGYTLEEWLEAEHELDDERQRPAKDRIH